MKRLLLIITSLLFITSTTFSQSKVNVNSLKEYGGKVWKVDDDKPYTGRVFDLNRSTGKKILQGQYKNGLKTGKWTEWYRNGQKEYETTFKDGKPNGLFTKWDSNGQKKVKGTYKDGKWDGLNTSWYENGQKYSEGTYTYKDGDYSGEKDGLWTYWYENGQKRWEKTYKDGELISKKEWNEDGSVKE